MVVLEDALMNLPEPKLDIAVMEKTAEANRLRIVSTGKNPVISLPFIEFKCDKYYFIKIKAAAPCARWSIYYITNMGESHCEKNRISFFIYNNLEELLIVQLPFPLIPQRLRLDPGNEPGEIIIDELTIVEANYNYDLNATVNIYMRCHGMNDAAWKQMILLTLINRRIGDMIFPGWPCDDVQQAFTGSAGEKGVEESFVFYSGLKVALEGISWQLGEESKALDFGCGYGRITRLFLKDLAPGNLFAADTYTKSIELFDACFKDCGFPMSNLIHNAPFPSLPFADASIDLITAFSVFSHLREDAAIAWLTEFARILKPGGIIAMTIRQDTYLASLRQLRNVKRSKYQESQLNGFGDIDKLDELWLQGKHLFAPTGGGGQLSEEFYGEAIIPNTWINKVTDGKFIVRARLTMRGMLQNLVVLQAM